MSIRCENIADSLLVNSMRKYDWVTVYKCFGLDSLTMNQGFFLPFSFLAVKWEKAGANAKKKSQNKKRRLSGQKINWYLVLQSLFKLFVIYKFFVCLTVSFFVYLSQSSFVCLFQDKTEVRVFEVENAGENEKIVEISTGPKGSKKYVTCFMLILREFVVAEGGASMHQNNV